ncbi:DUF1622 domain-containing protein [Muricoccus pecuniae]|uniref:Putative membrane protein n=1 Tax=Muricoccus pecuniae TaxID=693023 RepID=A0A840XYI6_9PROT|nr:DUF1622 domain-containing protein [Roseomonas pecuniae]MBB5692956.1 putative membrane protein [Roseomonas pecuniae]
MTETIKEATLLLATATEAIAGVLIAIAIIEATFRIAGVLLRAGRRGNPGESHEEKEEVRLRLGRWLALALEFELGADILRTAIAPTWSEIGQLAAIAAVRTALNFFLQREIDGAAARRGLPGAGAFSSRVESPGASENATR